MDPSWTTEFRGYPEQDFVSLGEAKVLGLLSAEQGKRVDVLRKGEKGWCVLDRTVFYPEGGGQVADEGEILWKEKSSVRAARPMGAPKSSTRGVREREGHFFTF